MECDEKEFGWLWKNVGGHFPCLLHGLYVNLPISQKYFYFLFILGAWPARNPSKDQTAQLS